MAVKQRNALDVGTEVGGYRILSILGAGGFGITYQAVEISLDRKVAIKEFMPSGIAMRAGDSRSVHPISDTDETEYEWGLERFQMEAKTLVNFKHPNIVPVLRYFDANGTAYMVMEFQEGQSLGAILDRAKTLEESEIVEIMRPLLSGLEQVHKAGFLHRDIKPDNIYIRADGSPVLIDFGAARQALGKRSKSLTAVVSAGYAPYEQYESEGNQGAWTDIYALGAVLYRCATGRKPIDAPARMSATYRGDEDPLVPASLAGAGRYSAGLLDGIDHALQIVEKKRPQSIAELCGLLNLDASAKAAAPIRAAITDSAVAAAGTRVVGDPARQSGPRARQSQPRQSQPKHIMDASAATKRKAPMLAIAAGIAVLVLGGGAFLAFGTGGKDSMRDAQQKAEEAQRQAVAAKNELDALMKKRDAEEQAKRDAEAKARAEAEAAAKRAAEADAARKAAEEARQRAENELRDKAARDAADKAALDARRRADEEERKKAEADARLKAELEAARQAQAKLQAELDAARQVEAKARAEAEARAKAEADARAKAEAEARLQADKEAKAKADAGAKARADAEAKKKAEDEVKKKSIADVKAKADADANRKADEAAKKKAADEVQKKLAVATVPAQSDLRSIVADTTAYGQLSGVGLLSAGVSVIVKVRKDGTTTFNATPIHSSQMSQSKNDSGSWSLSSNQLCMQFRELDQGRQVCYGVSINEKGFALLGAGTLAGLHFTK